MTQRSRFAGIALLTLAAGGCANGITETPTAPAGVRVTALTMTPVGGGTMIAGDSIPITSSGTTLGLGVMAGYSDGSVSYVHAAWTSSDTSVITVDGVSMAAIGRGTARVTARAEGLAVTEPFTVEPTVAGIWSGGLVVEQCSANSGSMSEVICRSDPPSKRGLFPVGGWTPISLQIQKNGRDLVVTGGVGEVRGALGGTDLGSNYLTLQGELRSNQTRLSILEWKAHVATDVMESQVAFEVRIDGLPGHALVVARFDQVTRR